jgi:hypothetical protein
MSRRMRRPHRSSGSARPIDAHIDPKESPLDQRRFVRRSDPASGMVRIEVQLPPEQAAIVWEALSTALDAGRSQDDASAESDDAVPAGASAETKRPGFDPGHLPAERADALVSVAQAYLTHSPRTLGSGYELVLMSTKDQLEHGASGIGGYLRDGTPVPLHLARMLACDCSRVDVEVGQSGEILDVGRARRSIPSAIGRALWLRDGGCRAPGCGRRHHLHAHHIEEWADGGKTAMSNLVLLCPGHHLQLHEGNLSVAIREGKLEFENRHGLKLESVPARSDSATAAVDLCGEFLPEQQIRETTLKLGRRRIWMAVTKACEREPTRRDRQPPHRSEPLGTRCLTQAREDHHLHTGIIARMQLAPRWCASVVGHVDQHRIPRCRSHGCGRGG